MPFFDINSGEFLILLVIALLIIGPSRIQDYTRKGANMVRELRRMANGARAQLEEEVGEDFTNIDWKKLDPRQYDPRKIIKDVFAEDFQEAIDEVKDITAEVKKPIDADEPSRPAVPIKKYVPLVAGERAPFDTEAT